MVLPREFIDGMLRVLVAVALAIDALIHLQHASYYQVTAPAGMGQGSLFLIEAAAAILAGLYVLLRGSRAAYAAALIVAAGGVAAVLLYRYVNVPAFGPFPAMYEPVWFFQKSLSALAEAAGAVLAAVGLVRSRKSSGPRAHGSLPAAPTVVPESATTTQHASNGVTRRAGRRRT